MKITHAFVIYEACGCHARVLAGDTGKKADERELAGELIAAARESRRVEYLPVASARQVPFDADCGRRAGPALFGEIRTPGWYEVRDPGTGNIVVRAWGRRGGWHAADEAAFVRESVPFEELRRLGDLEPDDTQLSPIEQMERAARRVGRLQPGLFDASAA